MVDKILFSNEKKMLVPSLVEGSMKTNLFLIICSFIYIYIYILILTLQNGRTQKLVTKVFSSTNFITSTEKYVDSFLSLSAAGKESKSKNICT